MHRHWLAGVALSLLMMQPLSQVWAHAKLVRSDPAARAVVARAPVVIQLWFNERIEPAYSTAELQGEDGRVIPTAKAEVDAHDPKLLVLSVPALANGAYVVVYRVLSIDGHVVKSRLRFTVRAPSK